MSVGNRYFNDVGHQEELFLKLISSLEERERTILERALALSKDAHRFQQREEGIPYIIHPIRVALYILRDLKIADTDLLAAALLHDVVEDGGVTPEEVQRCFGQRVAGLVEQLTRQRPANETEEQKREARRKKLERLLRAEQDVRIVKCSDLLDNMRSWPYIPPSHSARKKLPRWIEEAEKYYVLIAEKTNKDLAFAMREALRPFQ